MNILPLVADFLATEPSGIESFAKTLSVTEITTLAHISSWCQEKLEGVLSQRLSIRKILDKFFVTASERLTFTQLHRKTDFYISGSQALQFFNDEAWENSDLDLYCWPHTEGLVLSILSELGYSRPNSTSPVAPPEIYYPGSREIYRVINLCREIDGSIKSIQVVMAIECPLKTILQFHSSA